MELNPYAPPAADLEGAPASDGEPLFFPVSPLKLTLLYFASLGLYQLVWFYKSWKLVRNRGEEIYPAARAIFGVFFCYSLFKRVQDEARREGVRMTGSAGLLAAAWILLTLAPRLPDPMGLPDPVDLITYLSYLSFLSILPMLAVQKTVNALNRRAAPGHDPSSRFSAGNIVVMVIGFPLLLASFELTVMNFLVLRLAGPLGLAAQ